MYHEKERKHKHSYSFIFYYQIFDGGCILYTRETRKEIFVTNYYNDLHNNNWKKKVMI